MKEKINNIIDNVNLRTDWPIDYKIRYIYIELGKIVHKDALFFYTVLDSFLEKESEVSYTLEEIRNIITSDEIDRERVICYNIAVTLKYIFDHCGIENKIMSSSQTTTYKTSEGSVDYRHYFNCVTGDNNRKYFISLKADIENIQANLKTEHYGVRINYQKKVDNKYIQTYNGEEIDVVRITDEEINAIDEAIGYKNSYINDKLVYYDVLFDQLKKDFSDNYAYYYYNVARSNIYLPVFNILHNNTDMDNLVKKDIKSDTSFFLINIKNFNQHNVLKLYLLYNYFYYFNMRFNLGLSYKEFVIFVMVRVNITSDEPDYNQIKKYFHEMVKVKNNKSVYSFKVLDNLVNLCKNLDKAKKGLEFDNNFFNRNLVFVLSYFMKDIYLYLDEEPSVTYLCRKLVSCFRRIFDIGHKTDFNKLEIAEQTFIIKKIISIIFQDVIFDRNNPKNKKSIEDLVITSTLIDKETKEYNTLIYIHNKNGNGFMPIVYDLKNNTLCTDKSMLDIMKKYVIVRNTTKKLVIEDIESVGSFSK